MDFPITGQRTVLRPFELSDANEMLSIYGDSEVMEYVAYGNPVADVADVQTMLRKYIDHQRQYGYAFWAVVHAETGRLIGDAGFENENGEVEVGYTLGKSWWGQGYATEVARLCIATAFGPLNIQSLTALVDPRNPRSANVLKKLGFSALGEREAYGRTHLAYELRRTNSKY